MDKPTIVRPCGKYEQYSVARHSMGIYRCVSNTCRYQTRSPLKRESWEKSISSALASVIEAEPFLRVGIVGEDSTSPSYVHVPSIDLSRHVAWHSILHSPGTEYDSELLRLLEKRHDTLWPDIHRRPPWTVTLVESSSEDDGSNVGTDTLDIVFSFHHAIGDGLSGKAFHESLLRALRDNTSTLPMKERTPAPTVLQCPDPTVLPAPQEEAVKFTFSWWYILKTLWEEFRPAFLAPKKEDPWAGNPVDLHGRYATNLRLAVIDGQTVQGLLTLCRMHSTTLTGLLHVLVLVSLARHLPSEGVFAGSTAMSLRPYVSESAKDSNKNSSMRCLVTSLDHKFERETVSEIQSLVGDSDREDTTSTALEAKVWQLAAAIKEDLKAKAAELPANDVMGMLHFVSDWHERFRKADGKPQEKTWEVSNVGTISGHPDNPNKPFWISRQIFSQSAMLTGAAIGVNVAGHKELGDVNATLSWQDGLVESSLVDAVRSDLEEWAKNLAQYGRLR